MFTVGSRKGGQQENYSKEIKKDKGILWILYVSSLTSRSLHSVRNSGHVINIYKEIWDLQLERVP